MRFLLHCPTHDMPLVGDPFLTESDEEEHPNEWLIDLSDVVCPDGGNSLCLQEWQVKLVHGGEELRAAIRKTLESKRSSMAFAAPEMQDTHWLDMQRRLINLLDEAGV